MPIKERYYSPDYRGNRIRNIGAPTNPDDASSKNYVYAIESNLITSIENDRATDLFMKAGNTFIYSK